MTVWEDGVSRGVVQENGQEDWALAKAQLLVCLTAQRKAAASQGAGLLQKQQYVQAAAKDQTFGKHVCLTRELQPRAAADARAAPRRSASLKQMQAGGGVCVSGPRKRRKTDAGRATDLRLKTFHRAPRCLDMRECAELGAKRKQVQQPKAKASHESLTHLKSKTGKVSRAAC